MIQEHIDAVLSAAERAGVPPEKIAAIRDGDRGLFLALLGAILATTSCDTVVWAGAKFRAEEMEDVKEPALKLWALVRLMSKPSFWFLVRYDRRSA